jgi:hypothetical protein
VRFSEVVELLGATRNAPVILEARASSAAIAVAPDLVGRVVCSTFDRKLGQSNAWINKEAILAGKVDPVFNNFGGEERFWFAPEGGPFGLMFGTNNSSFNNYCVQDGMSSLAYHVVRHDDQSVLMQAEFSLQNASRTKFQLRVDRRVSLLESSPFAMEAPEPLEFAAFQTENVVTNVGDATWDRKGGALAIWCLGQFMEKPRLSVIVPVRPASDSTSMPPTVDEYFKDFCIDGVLPPGRRANFDSFVLLKADGKVRAKIGVKRERATGRLGSYDPESDHLTIVDFDFYPELDYPTGYWRTYGNAFDGDALSVYIDGPQEPGGPGGAFYELETMSPAMFLRPGESFAYRNRTHHLRGRRKSIGAACERFLRAEIKQLEEFYGGPF